MIRFALILSLALTLLAVRRYRWRPVDPWAAEWLEIEAAMR